MTSGPSLLYLTVYNTSLKPENPVEDDDDAEEHAQILFYTSRERVVSRDRMLRHVGLAKAMVNFSSMFHPAESSNYVHSQSRRMIMLSPEQDFWVHAGVELAKLPRQSKKDQKAKSKSSVNIEYNEASIHNLALRAQLSQAYEHFKLTHGSFTTILNTLGREALELQLERFFTVWAWSWDLDSPHEFSDQFSMPEHPLQKEVEPSLDALCSGLTHNDVSSVGISLPYHFRSTGFNTAGHPPSIFRFLSPLIPPPVDSSPLSSDNVSITIPLEKISQSSSQTSFLGMSTINLDMNMNTKKWRWPDYLTVGTAKKPSDPDTAPNVDPKAKEKVDEISSTQQTASSPGDNVVGYTESIKVDQSALDDAMANDQQSAEPSISESEETAEISTAEPPLRSIDEDSLKTPTPPRFGVDTSPVEGEITPPAPTFLSRKIHLPTRDEPLLTFPSKMYYIERGGILLAFIGLPTDIAQGELDDLAVKTEFAIQGIRVVLETAELKKDAEPPRQKRERHIVSARQSIVCSHDFSTKSEHLFNGRQMLEEKGSMDMCEVFSKNQASPQQWILSRRDLGIDSRTGEDTHGEVFLEVLKKDATLPDVDNMMSSVIKNAQ